MQIASDQLNCTSLNYNNNNNNRSLAYDATIESCLKIFYSRNESSHEKEARSLFLTNYKQCFSPQ